MIGTLTVYPLSVTLLCLAFVFLFGSVIGSFLNVVIYRVPKGLSFAKGRSFCPSCKQQLQERDMIPVLSWLVLGGHCRNCGQNISPRYPLIELATAVLALVAVLVFGFTWQALAVFALMCGLLAIAMIDYDTMEIPNGLIIYLFFPAIAMIFLAGNLFFMANIVIHVIGFFAIALPMYLLSIVIRDCFGGGDIKLMAVCGLALGWKLITLAMFIALVFGGGYAVYLLKAQKAGRKSHFAFGPFLVAGIIIALLAGNQILGWYFSLF